MNRGLAIGIGLGSLGVALVIGGFLLLSDESNTIDYRTPTPSMAPTFEVGDTVTVDLDAYKANTPEIGDVITFHPPSSAEFVSKCGAPKGPREVCGEPVPERSDLMFIKRVVALPGDEVSIEQGVTIVNGARAEEDFIRPCRTRPDCNLPEPVTIPEDHYFVLGDNRGGSEDSRHWGPVPLEWIQGRVED